MSVEWIVEESDPKRLKEFLKEKDISRRIIARTKFQGGSFEVNGRDVRVREPLKNGDQVVLNLPLEEANPELNTSHGPLDILYEDEHYLMINKPVDLMSVPSQGDREDTVANRVKGYFIRNDYKHQVVHIITRLDRFTSGVLMVAKNALAHSLMGKQLDEKTLEKYYLAIAEGHLEPKKGLIDAPIARSQDSIIERVVDPSGKPSRTGYEMTEKLENNLSLVHLTLYTGRTHQIRVHMSHLGHPLVGDDLYGGSTEYLNRQALHCQKMAFRHPFSGNRLEVKAPLPEDMQTLVDRKME